MLAIFKVLPVHEKRICRGVDFHFFQVTRRTKVSESTTMAMPPVALELVAVHPLVLLSVVDHFSRVAGGTSGNRRVVGVLLGQESGKTIHVTNSFACKLRISWMERL
jgi:hypothetical protein